MACGLKASSCDPLRPTKIIIKGTELKIKVCSVIKKKKKKERKRKKEKKRTTKKFRLVSVPAQIT